MRAERNWVVPLDVCAAGGVRRLRVRAGNMLARKMRGVRLVTSGVGGAARWRGAGDRVGVRAGWGRSNLDMIMVVLWAGARR